MLRIYSVALDICRDASRVAKLVEKHDTSLANQLRRCASSVPLNLREGSGSFGGNRKLRYHTALGSSGEVLACYDTAEAMGYIDAVGSDARDRVGHVIGTQRSSASDDEAARASTLWRARVRYQHIPDTFGLRTSLTVQKPGDALEGAARDASEVGICGDGDEARGADRALACA